MPADYKSAAAGLSVSPSLNDSSNKTPSATSAAAQLGGMDDPAPFHDDEDDDDDDDAHDYAPPAAATQSVPWARPANTTRSSTNASRRLSTPYSRSSTHTTPLDIRSQLTDFALMILKTSRTLYRRGTTYFFSLNPTQQFLFLAGGVVTIALAITGIIFSSRLFHVLGPVAISWRNVPGGWLLVWVATFLVAFPPLIGYSSACTVAGFIYGFPLGWPIVATASVAGSTAAFIASRTVLAGYVDRLVGRDKRFVALGQVLRHDGLGVLALVRFCPLPYSLSNGFLATVPSIAPASFALATAFASPKLLVHVFIGSRLAVLAEKGDEMRLGDRLVNYVSMVVGMGVGMGVGFFIYRRTMARAAELAREEGGGVGAQPLGGASSGDGGYEDDVEDGEGARLMNPDDAAALMVDADDISLWDAAGDDEWNDADGSDIGHGGAGAEAGHGRYRDEEESVGGDGGGRKIGDSE